MSPMSTTLYKVATECTNGDIHSDDGWTPHRNPTYEEPEVGRDRFLKDAEEGKLRP